MSVSKPLEAWGRGRDEQDGRTEEEELVGTRLNAEETSSENSWTEKGVARSREMESLEREIEAIDKEGLC